MNGRTGLTNTEITHTEITREEAERRLTAIYKAMRIRADIAAQGTWEFGDGAHYYGLLTVSADGLPHPRG